MKVTTSICVLEGTRDNKAEITAFMPLLKKLNGFHYNRICKKYHYDTNKPFDFYDDNAENMLEDIFEALNKCAGHPDMYFGNVEYGDVDRFGFWFMDTRPGSGLPHDPTRPLNHDAKRRPRVIQKATKVIYRHN